MPDPVDPLPPLPPLPSSPPMFLTLTAQPLETAFADFVTAMKVKLGAAFGIPAAAINLVNFPPPPGACTCPICGGRDEPALPLMKNCTRVLIIWQKVGGRWRLENWEEWGRLRNSVRAN